MTSFVNRTIFNAVAGGTADFVVASAVTGYQTPTTAEAIDGATYHYAAQLTDLSQWEDGAGTWDAGTHTLIRVAIFDNSLGTGTNQGGPGTKINFATAPQVLLTVLKDDIAPPLTLTDGTNTVADVAQITVLGATVGGTTPDATLKINPIIAQSNLTFTVSPTGNDSNLPFGPFATIQAAATQAGLYNWILGYKPTIQIDDGTYAESNITLPVLINISTVSSKDTGIVQGNVLTPANVVISDPAGNGVFYGFGNNCFWTFSGLSIDTAYGCFLPAVGAKFYLAVGTVFNWTDSTNSGFSELAIIDTFSQFVAAGLTINVGASTIYAITECDNYSNCVIDRNTINFPVGGTVASYAWFSIESYSNAIWFGNTLTGGALTGPALSMFQVANIATQNALATTDVPGNISTSIIDASSSIVHAFGAGGENFATQQSGLPTTSNLDPGGWGIFLDSSSGFIYLAYNNAGTIETSNISTGGGIGANPTATAGPTAVNGTATTFIRSDGAPAVQLGTNAQKGIVQVDGTTIIESGGVITATGSGVRFLVF